MSKDFASRKGQFAVENFYEWLNELWVPEQLMLPLYECAEAIAPNEASCVADSYNHGEINGIEYAQKLCAIIEQVSF